ncbi:sensor histidine kinase [Variovorax sp. PvP013]|uniref:sensor histidine kinase n=1 Tax=Variovorax sp. PvP013 TaxID=3156435 RepID=UPI003D2079B8
MRTPRTSQEPGDRRWSSPRRVLLGGLALAVLMLVTSAAIFVKVRASVVEEQQKRNALYARVLENYVTRSVDTVGLALAGIASDLGVPLTATGKAVSSNLRQILVSLPQLRSLAVVQPNGLVTAASDEADVGRRIDMTRLGPPPASSRPGIGSYVPGRGLSSIALGSRSAVSPGAIGFIPVMQRVRLPSGDVLVVALLHADGLVGQMRLTIDDPTSRAALTGLDGRLYGDTADALPGTSLADHTVFKDFLPRIEHANFDGPGIDPDRQTGAFRVSSSWPLVVIVERPLQRVTSAWLHSIRAQLVVAAFAVLVTVGLTIVASRSLKAREEARQGRNRLLAKIARSEQELSVIVRSVQEFLFRTDAEGVLTFVNAHWMEATGGSQQAILGTRLEEVVATQERPRVQAMLAPASNAGVRTATLTFWASTGHPRRVDIALVPLHDGQRLIGFAGSAVDITAREEAEARLAQQLAFMALLQDLSPLPTTMRDMAGQHVEVNRAWLEFFGLGRSDVLGKDKSCIVQDAEQRFHEAQERRLSAAERHIQYEATFTRSDGERRDMLINKVLVPGRDGRPQGILSTFMDVTDLRDASRATQEAREAAEEASRVKSEFIANVSHELRTPLQSIIGFSELGAGRMRHDALVSDMFSDILSSGQRMLTLVNDLLDVAKIESAVGTIHLERTDLRPLLRLVVRELAPLIDAKRLVIDLRLPPAPVSTRVDPFRFQQVVRNVLANAIRFSDVGESIQVGARFASDQSIHVWVRDRGPGIPAGELEAIFDAFVQSSKTKDGAGGTGLGLAICRKILDAHRGTISARNVEGGGACFDVLLPPNDSTDTVPGVLAEPV